MSLDLIKNALYQRIRTNLPGLTFMPEHQPGVNPEAIKVDENDALLSFVEINTERTSDPQPDEYLTATVDGDLVKLPVLANFQTIWRLQLLQRPGPSRSIEAIRTANAGLVRDLAKLRKLDLGDEASLAVFWYVRDRHEFDRESQAHLLELTQRIEWKLIESTAAGTPLNTSETIEVYFNGSLLITVD